MSNTFFSKSINNKYDFSMAPLILPADKPIIKKTNKYKVSDIVAFKRSEKLIAHRLIYISPDRSYFITKGDSNHKSDGKISSDNILGVIEKIERGKEFIALKHLYLSQSSTYLKELLKLINKFKKAKIEFVILKGLPIHLHLDGKVPRRLYLDVDILIKKNYYKKVNTVLNKLRFEASKSTLFGKPIKNPSQISFVKKTKPFYTIIDLHLEPAIGFTKLPHLNELISQLKPFTQHLLINTKKVDLEKTGFPILKNEILFVYLLLHLFHHNFKGAHRMELIDNMVRKQKINWDKVEKIVRKYHFENLIYPAVIILIRYYQTPFPNTFIKRVTPSPLVNFVSKLTTQLISPFDSGSRAQEGIKRLILLLLLSPVPATKKVKLLTRKEVKDYFLPTIKSFLRSS